MHYKNGREAHNGDKVVLIPSYGPPKTGILYGAVAGNDLCNGYLASPTPNDPTANLSECLHADDISCAKIPDSTLLVTPNSTMNEGELKRCYDLIHKYQSLYGDLH
jgi:hypothetical protein